MYLQVVGSNGTYTHAASDVALTVRREATFDEAERVNGYKEFWGLSGELQAANASALTTAMAALQRAYQGTLSRVSLYEDGGTLTHHDLTASNSVAGIIVANPPSYPQGGRDQYVLRRSYEIALMAEYRGGSFNVIAWTETIDITGSGGPRIAAIETRNTGVQMQQVSSRTPVIVTQSGQAVGRLSQPVPPGPLLPAIYEQGPERRRSATSPRLRGNRYEEYGVAWSYTFLLPVPGSATPTPWPKR